MLTDARHYLHREVNAYLGENYQSFLRTSESLKQVHAEFEELKTMSNQYNLVLSAIKSQVDRLSEPTIIKKAPASKKDEKSKIKELKAAEA